MTEATRRIDLVLAPEYLDGLEERSIDDVRSLHEECLEVETEVSYVRRLAQARIEILRAEQDRRTRGGSVADLVAALPQILADSGPRPDPASSRLTRHLAPAPAIRWTRGSESLIADDTLANLPTLTDAELADALVGLAALEQEVSVTRRSLHGVIDRIEVDLAAAADALLTGRLPMADGVEQRLRDLGEFIRNQREGARLSLRALSTRSGISNPYLSQIERGLRKPSAEILQQIARGLAISAETLYERAGFLDARGPETDLVRAIERTPDLDEREKRILIDLYRSLRRRSASEPDGTESPPGEVPPGGR